MKTQAPARASAEKPGLFTLKQFIIIEQSQITHCLAAGSYTKIYFTDREPLVYSRKLCFVHSILGFRNFLRCSRSCIVNIHCIKELKDGGHHNLLLSDGTVIKIAFRKKKEVSFILNENKINAVA